MPRAVKTGRHLEYQRVMDVTPAVRNPKDHNLPLIRGLIEQFGFTQPLLVDERTGRLVAGHGRLLVLDAMEKEQAAPPDGIRADESGIWLVPVTRGWSSRSDREAEAYLLADNRSSEVGGWVPPELSMILAEQDEELRRLIGWSDADTERLVASLAPPAAPEGFPEFDDMIETKHECPKCGYAWS